jgi:glycerol kinase
VSRELLLALDLGTTSVRALLLDAGGRTLARAARPLATRFPGLDRVEQDPRELWDASLAVLREALARSGRGAHELAGLGLATQRASALAWDAASGEPLAPMIGWQDGRAARRVAELRAGGVPITTLASATRFEALLREQPAVAAAARAGRLALGGADAWLGFRLSGGSLHASDPGQASCTGLYDLRRGAWSAAALGLFSLEPAWLPRIVASSEVIGETPAALLGAPVALAARAGDQQAASFGQGVHEEGDAKLTLGTAAMLDVHTGASPAPALPGAFPLALWRFAGADAFCLEGSVITAGAAIDWLVGVGLLAEAGALDAAAGEAPGAEGVEFVPALQGLGTPYLDPAARGLLGGLTRGTTRAHIARAAIDGVAQRCVDVCEALGVPDRPLRVDGGLSRSAALLQRLADAGGRPVLRAAEPETTALGAALLAGLAAGVLASPQACRSLIAAPAPFTPAWDAARRAAARARWRLTLERARAGADPAMR